jgi:hypothetical protein
LFHSALRISDRLVQGRAIRRDRKAPDRDFWRDVPPARVSK